MKNVLFFIFRLYGGGAERVVSNLSMAFSNQYNIKIAVFDNQQKVFPHNGDLIRIRLPFSGDPVHNNWFQRLTRFIVLIYKLKKIKREQKIDVTVSFAEQANIVNLLTMGSGRTVISVRTLLSKEMISAPKMRILGFFIKRLYGRAHQIIVPSKLAAEDLQKFFGVKPGKLKVIYNYVDQDKITSQAAEIIDDPFLRSLFDQPVILNVGRLTPAKGQWLLFELMKKIKPLHPDWKLVIVGESETEGNLKSDLLGLASQLGLQVFDQEKGQNGSLACDIYLLGFKANPYQYMRNSNVLAMPSVFEGFPNTVLEAMQTGLPVIVADCNSGPREILSPESDLSTHATQVEWTANGVLCPALTDADINVSVPDWLSDEWAGAVTEVMEKNEVRNQFIRNGLLRVRDFDKEAILAEWKNCIEGIG